MKKTDFFSAAIKAARAEIADPSLAHVKAIGVLRDLVPNKPDGYYADMGWQAVLAARNRHV